MEFKSFISCMKPINFSDFFQLQVSDMKLTFFVKVSLLGMMQFSNAQSLVLFLTLLWLMHGWTLKRIYSEKLYLVIQFPCCCMVSKNMLLLLGLIFSCGSENII